MLRRRSSFPGRRFMLLVVVGLVGVFAVSATANASASGYRQAVAQTAKKKCKKKHRSASSAKKCKKKTVVPPVVTPPAPTPSPLTNSEIISRVSQKAQEYGNEDGWWDGDYGYWSTDMEGNIPKCDPRSDLSATCEGWYEYYDPGASAYGECDFYEVIERDGLTGIRSHLDTSFSPGNGGFDCYLY